MKTKKIIASMCFIFFILSFNSYAITPQEWVDAHNKYRSRHINTSHVTWDDGLAQGAQACVNRVKGGEWSHTGGVSENGAFGYFNNAQDVVDYWHSEEQYYDYNTGTKKTTAPADETIGHFVQVVGSKIKKIGCACDPSAKTKVKATWYTGIYVCQYDDFGYNNVMPFRKIGDDILWYHVWGFPGVWFMNGAEFKSGTFVGWKPTEWKIVGTGDFNNDGKTEILWRNTKTGENLVWFMDGSTYKSQTALKSETDLSWKIVGTGDFNGDGRTDILWRHATTKQTLIWLMDGVKYTKSVYLPHSIHPDWEIVGAGDFNSDYHSDVLWRNTANGSVAVWYIYNALYKGLDIPAACDLDWKIGATGDLNDDGKTDILWRNTKTGQNGVWYMDGATYKSSAYLPTVAADLGFKMVGAGNFE
jgi:hypothetical protein